MSLLNRLFARSPKPPARRALAVEPLEGRDLMSASPLPVLLVVADQRDFYYREYADTRSAIEATGVGVVVGAATTAPSAPHGNTGQPLGTAGTITPDVALANADPADYSAIAFVGGWGASMYQYAYNDPDLNGTTDNFYSDSLYNGDPDLNDGRVAPQKVAANELINEFLVSDKPVAAICHGVTVLAWARVDGASPLAGKNVAVPHQEGTPDQFFAGQWRNGGYYTGQREQVLANGGLPTAARGAHGNPLTTADDVIVDGRIITGENPASASLFGTRIAEEVLASLPAGARMVGPDLVVTGTPGADTVYLWSGAAANQVYAWVDGTTYGYELPSGGRVRVATGSGNDQVFGTDLQAPLALSGGAGHDLLVGGSGGDRIDGGDGVDRVWGGLGDDLLVGGEGDDYLYGREGNDVLVGGGGNDVLEGEIGRDLLVGGLGADWVRGGGDDDILIGGTTVFDENDAALDQVRGVWVGAGGIDPRVGTLAAPAGIGLRADTVFDDAADSLAGGSGGDWHLHSAGDATDAFEPEDRATVV